MSRRIIISLVLALFATSIGIIGTLWSQTPRLALEHSSKASPSGHATRSGAMTFQKVNGSQADGAIGPQTAVTLANAVAPSLQGGPSNRIEVDLTEQVLYYVENGQVIRTMSVSSGNGKSYRTQTGRRARGLTPVGTFRVQRRIRGVRVSYLGVLHNPLYFYGGYAIHGSSSVPGYPASHGCIRVSQANARWLFDRAPVGTPVIVHGGTHVFRPGG
jgi:lipoprotein-anchoring transpeptidase ErfK/SrfK